MSDAADQQRVLDSTPDPRRGERRAVLLVLGAIVAYALFKGVLHTDDLYFFGAIVPSIILHEVSHGFVANIFGDDTAKRAGRLTLNPIAHIDLFGTLLMPAMLVMAGVRPIGFAKPVPVNVSRLRHPRNHSLLVGLAGPATNYLIAGLAAALFHTVHRYGWWAELLYSVGAVNVLLGTFNLLPIPPLDGSAVLERLLPQSMWPQYLRFRRVSMPLVIGVVFLFPQVFQHIYEPLLRQWEHVAGLRG
jgi:Zn-dependent protease